MNCPRCLGARVIRTADHDETLHFREPLACLGCGLAFNVSGPAQIGLFERVTVAKQIAKDGYVVS